MPNAKQRIATALKKYQKHPLISTGTLGNSLGVVSVPGKPNFVYVNIPGSGVAIVYNKRVANIPSLPVDVGRDVVEPDLYQVLNVHHYPSSDPNNIQGLGSIPNHGSSHTWGGTDPVYVSKRQLMPLRPTPIGGMNVFITREVAYYDGEWEGITGQVVDMTPYLPETGSHYALIYKDTDESFVVNSSGTLRDTLTLNLLDAPQPYPGTVPIALIRLYAGQSGILEGSNDTDLVDVRRLFEPLTDPSTTVTEKITELPSESTLALTDLTVIVHNPTGTPVTENTTIANLMLLSGHGIQSEGVDQTRRGKLNFVGQGVSLTDNGANDRTIITIPGATASDFIHNIDGALATGTGIAASVVSKVGSISRVYLYGFTLGSSSSTIVDVHKNGTTIFTTQGNRPTLAYNDADQVAVSGIPDVVDLAVGDVLTIDIDQVAVGSSGLTVVVAMSSVNQAPVTPFIGAKIFRSTDFSLTSADMAVPFDTELDDTDNIYDPGSNTKLTCQTAGWYHIIAGGSMDVSSGGSLHQFYVIKNGTEVLCAQGGPSDTQLQSNLSIQEHMDVGDYIELHAYHAEGGTITMFHYDTFAPILMMSLFSQD